MEAPIEWAVTVCSAAAAPVTIAQDTTETIALQSLADSWEKGAPGRAAKAKTTREAYFAAQVDTSSVSTPHLSPRVGSRPGTPRGASRERQEPIIHTKSAQTRVLAADDKATLRTQLEEALETQAKERQAADESRMTIKESLGTTAMGKVQGALASRAEIKEAYAAMLAESASIMATYAPPAEPVADDPKAKKGKK